MRQKIKIVSTKEMAECLNKKIETSKAPKATGPFSQAIVSGDFIFTSGQICLTAKGEMLKGDIEEQAKQVMNNLKEVLTEAGASFRDVVKTVIYVTDMSLAGDVNEVYAGYVSDPFPAREMICVKELPLGAKVEISVVAKK